MRAHIVISDRHTILAVADKMILKTRRLITILRAIYEG